MKHIYHHLGMGDHITCSGIVRHYAAMEEVNLFVKYQNLRNVERLYRDASNITLIPVTNDAGVKLYTDIHPSLSFIRITNNVLGPIDKIFYESVGLSISFKWAKFYLERDMQREKEVYYDVYGLKDGEEYSFVHMSDKAPSLPHRVIVPDDWSVGLFDFIYLLEHAKSIHLENSSFFCLVDTMQIEGPELYIDYSIRSPEQGFTTSPKLKWNVLGKDTWVL